MIKWEGKGKPDLPNSAMVKVRLRDGTEFDTAYPIGDWRWSHSAPSRWSYSADIVAYEVVDDKPKAQQHLPTDAAERKGIPVYSGFIRYFPDAIIEVAKLSKIGNDQHNPSKPLHWDRSKSGDELDAMCRHLLDADEVDIDDVLHATKVAWRSMANLQKLVEKRRAK